MPNEKENIVASSYYSSNLCQELEFGHGFEEDRQRAAQGSAKRSSNFIQSRWPTSNCVDQTTVCLAFLMIVNISQPHFHSLTYKYVQCTYFPLVLC